MIDTKLLAPYPAPYSAPVRSKREPKPSTYAVSIQNFKEQQQKQQRKHRNSCNHLQETHQENCPIGSGPLRCVLPSGKKISLSIIVRKKEPKVMKKKTILKKSGLKETKTGGVSCKKEMNQGPDLLTKFLMAAQELNKMDQEEPEQLRAEPVSLSQIREGKEERKARSPLGENEQNIRLCERGKVLGRRIQNILNEMIYL